MVVYSVLASNALCCTKPATASDDKPMDGTLSLVFTNQSMTPTVLTTQIVGHSTTMNVDGKPVGGSVNSDFV